ncbi:hypothetical protein [Paenibacillus humicola]|uniref:hypothetical protein n=1 Tax=Paenibacillus humicola TaxID=3110540 RepID=UPI00237C4E36|nr:hypothetical protein [Paenibacillus humicola]
MNALAETKIEQLRPIEQLCYQIAHYLLGDDIAAAAASEDALIELYRSPQFFEAPEQERRLLARKAVMRHAIRKACGRRQPH